jgi:hypothetical protein
MTNWAHLKTETEFRLRPTEPNQMSGWLHDPATYPLTPLPHIRISQGSPLKGGWVNPRGRLYDVQYREGKLFNLSGIKSQWYSQHLVSTQNRLSTNSVALSPQANYTDWATATCRRNLVHNFCG